MTKEEIKRHKIAAKRLETITARAFGFIKRNIGKVSEYEVNRFILSEFKKEALATDKKHSAQIVAVNRNAAVPHYFPDRNKSAIIKIGDLILIDTWARLKRGNSPFADISWMGYFGKNVPKKIESVFTKVIGARSAALDFIEKSLEKGKLPKTKDVDGAARGYFKIFKLEKHFLHGLGHSLGINECHGKYFRFGRKSKARLKSNIPFTIEPGLYFKDKFGIRSEINCHITEDYKLVVTTKIQDKIIKI